MQVNVYYIANLDFVSGDRRPAINCELSWGKHCIYSLAIPANCRFFLPSTQFTYICIIQSFCLTYFKMAPKVAIVFVRSNAPGHHGQSFFELELGPFHMESSD